MQTETMLISLQQNDFKRPLRATLDHDIMVLGFLLCI